MRNCVCGSCKVKYSNKLNNCPNCGARNPSRIPVEAPSEYSFQMPKTLRELERTKRAEIVEDIRKAVRRRAAAEGYRYVFDSSGRTLNEQPALLVYPDNCDLTTVVIEDLNRTAVRPHPAAAAPEKAKNR